MHCMSLLLCAFGVQMYKCDLGCMNGRWLEEFFALPAAMLRNMQLPVVRQSDPYKAVNIEYT